jgi:hypothetical protein
MKRVLTACLLAVASTLLFAPSASATIHPIVESADCANATADAAHPLGDVADPPGQTPGFGNHSDNSSLRAIQVAITTPAAFGHKLNGTCGNVGQ